MRALLQRVKESHVAIDGKVVSSVGKGLLVLLGVTHGDTEEGCRSLVNKITNLRIFEDEAGKMNLSLLDIKGSALVVSQFTLYADCRKGRRPSFTDAASPEKAKALYDSFIQEFQKTGLSVKTGEFQARMDVSLVNSGPVTIMLDTKE